MSIENGPSEEEMDPDGLTMEERAFADAYLAELDKQNEIVELRFSEKEIAEFEGLIESFKSSYSLEELNAVTHLTPENARSNRRREDAKQDLIPIVKLMNTLRQETDIADEKYGELKAKYLVLSKAVGIINNGKVRH